MLESGVPLNVNMLHISSHKINRDAKVTKMSQNKINFDESPKFSFK